MKCKPSEHSPSLVGAGRSLEESWGSYKWEAASFLSEKLRAEGIRPSLASYILPETKIKMSKKPRWDALEYHHRCCSPFIKMHAAVPRFIVFKIFDKHVALEHVFVVIAAVQEAASQGQTASSLCKGLQGQDRVPPKPGPCH